MATNPSPKKYWLRLTVFAVILFGCATIFVLLYLAKLQLNVFITPKKNPDIGTLDELNRPYQDVELTTVDGLKISGWYVPGSKSQAIVLVHGIDANRQAVIPEAKILSETGYHLLLIDLRAHGQSEGNQATYGYREAWDVQAAVNYLADQPDVEQIGALGTSFGGAAVARAAAIDPRLKAVVIESSYSSLPEAVEDAFEDLSIFPKWPFAPLFIAIAERRVGLEISQVNSVRDLATVSPRAIMIIHGSADDLFPLPHAQRMFEAAGEPKELWVIEGMTHSNPAVEQEAEFRARVLPFFRNAFGE